MAVNYFTAPVINLPAKLDTDTGIVTIQDLVLVGKPAYVEYSPAELRLIEQRGGMSEALHLCKKVLGAEIVGVYNGISS